MTPIAAIIDLAREQSREALGREDTAFMLRWLAAVALTFAKGSHGYMRLLPRVPYRHRNSWGRKHGL